MIKRRNTYGFTLVETIVTVAVISLLLALMVPPVTGFLQKYRERQEDVALHSMRLVLEQIAKEYNRLPSDDPSDNDFCGSVDSDVDANADNDWYECIAAFGSTSVDGVRLDIWGNPRVYVHREQEEEFLDTKTTMHYVTIHSMGNDFVAANTTLRGGNLIDGIALAGDRFADASDSGWWARSGSDTAAMTEFQGLVAGGDDRLLKFSDAIIKIAKFHKTRQRLEAISGALESYKESRNYEASVTNPTTYQEFVYYPPSIEVNTVAPPLYEPSSDSYTRHDAAVRTHLLTYGLTRVENRDATVTQKRARLDNMVTLMRLLGLPDSYCCDALQKEPDAVSPADDTQERPFFYYSNPRPKRYNGGAIVCETRPQTVGFLPAFMGTEDRNCN